MSGLLFFVLLDPQLLRIFIFALGSSGSPQAAGESRCFSFSAEL
jgi:hypothetical protein